MADARGVCTGAASLVPEVPTPADGAVVASMATVFLTEALCAERAVGLVACELVAAPKLSLGLPVSAHATPAPELTAAPIPRAMASPPTRPILAEAFMSTP